MDTERGKVLRCINKRQNGLSVVQGTLVLVLTLTFFGNRHIDAPKTHLKQEIEKSMPKNGTITYKNAVILFGDIYSGKDFTSDFHTIQLEGGIQQVISQANYGGTVVNHVSKEKKVILNEVLGFGGDTVTVKVNWTDFQGETK